MTLERAGTRSNRAMQAVVSVPRAVGSHRRVFSMVVRLLSDDCSLEEGDKSVSPGQSGGGWLWPAVAGM